MAYSASEICIEKGQFYQCRGGDDKILICGDFSLAASARRSAAGSTKVFLAVRT
jgi:hypothetical protein